MIPTLAILTAVGAVLACIGAPGCSFAASRIRRRARNWTDFTLWRPDVPPLRTVSDEDWLADQPEMLTADDAPPPLMLPADFTPADLEQAVTAHDFIEIVWGEFPQYRKDFADGAA